VPELPEVETVRRGLEGVGVGRQAPADLTTRLVGRTFTAAGRRGKFLLLSLDDDAVLVVHLRMSGQLLHLSGTQRPPIAAHTHVMVGLGDGTELRFVDPRTFGEWFVSSDVDSRRHREHLRRRDLFSREAQA
jgi:formamidopyrimidine-DNA glycosylase